MPRLSTLLNEELQKRGWDDRRLAKATGRNESIISSIRNDPTALPSLTTINALSIVLGIPMRELVAACGIDIDAAAQIDEAQRVQQMSTVIPEIQLFLPLLTQLTLDDRLAILAHSERRIQLHASQ
ncbi:helix-turn-helix transcriptional regulator [Herpetosiphon gulosus]|uniref:HTH cro/C1-type domain-containing protein n=1 Tax=Herpetosiphon gulosus TaxID=1973496 RepID=A0ABP9X884_9CHLR